MNKKGFSISDFIHLGLIILLVGAILSVFIYPATQVFGKEIDPFIPKQDFNGSAKDKLLGQNMASNTTQTCSLLDMINPFSSECHLW